MKRENLNDLADNLTLLSYIVLDEELALAASEAAAALQTYIDAATAANDPQAFSWTLRQLAP
ncbi:hypothetical protein [Agrococcus terreus]|uniref:Uncharacterized protein n=1 Tax=Agrococcus terreus TaxID=574649 RepID=A0ABQ2KI22_9MICO|nr:hypothetical protein [Agrococcus terreus]GGN82353.1 hypothetical protein GCM10010968_12070 [Agrococcus terreus]